MATDDFVVNIAGEGGPLRIDLEANVSLGTVEWSPSHTHTQDIAPMPLSEEWT